MISMTSMLSTRHDRRDSLPACFVELNGVLAPRGWSTSRPPCGWGECRWLRGGGAACLDADEVLAAGVVHDDLEEDDAVRVEALQQLDGGGEGEGRKEAEREFRGKPIFGVHQSVRRQTDQAVVQSISTSNLLLDIAGFS